MGTKESSWFSTFKLELAQAFVQKQNGHIVMLRTAMDGAFEKLNNVDINAWKLEGRSLINCMEEVSVDLKSMETNVGVSKVAGGTAGVLGGALAIAACLLSHPAKPFPVPGPVSQLAIASTILGTAAGVTSVGTELAKLTTLKPRLRGLRSRYDAFFKETQNLQHVFNELLGLLNQVLQLASEMFSILELADEAACKALKLQQSTPKIAWSLDMENLSAEGCVMLSAVGAIVKEGKDVKMTKIGKALAAFCKSPEEYMQLPSPMLGEELKGLHLNFDKERILRAGIYVIGSTATMEEGQGVVLLSAGVGVWDVMAGVKSLHQGSHAARVLQRCVWTMQRTIIPMQMALGTVL